MEALTREESNGSESTSFLHVRNLTRSVSEAHLLEIFSIHGKVIRAQLLKDRGLVNGDAYIEFQKSEDAEEAHDHWNTGQLDGKIVSTEIKDRAWVDLQEAKGNTPDSSITHHKRKREDDQDHSFEGRDKGETGRNGDYSERRRSTGLRSEADSRSLRFRRSPTRSRSYEKSRDDRYGSVGHRRSYRGRSRSRDFERLRRSYSRSLSDDQYRKRGRSYSSRSRSRSRSPSYTSDSEEERKRKKSKKKKKKHKSKHKKKRKGKKKKKRRYRSESSSRSRSRSRSYSRSLSSRS